MFLHITEPWYNLIWFTFICWRGVYTERTILGSPIMECSLKLSKVVKHIAKAISIFNYGITYSCSFSTIGRFFFPLSNLTEWERLKWGEKFGVLSETVNSKTEQPRKICFCVPYDSTKLKTKGNWNIMQ